MFLLSSPTALSAPAPVARVLIVDDHPNTARMLARALCGLPVEVRTAASAPDALSHLSEWGGAEVLITDFMMPGMNGLELVERVGRWGYNPQVVMVTAYDSQGLRATAKRLGVHLYRVKPIPPDWIRTTVSEMLECALSSS